MIVLIQRVKHANLLVENKSIGEINGGLLLYIGFEDSDNEEKIKWILNKIVSLRMFSDKEDKMNLSLLDIKGELMVIPNFTLLADLNDSGRRPSFTKSARPEIAEKLYNQFVEEARRSNIKVASGKFGAMMEIESMADGPVNFILKR